MARAIVQLDMAFTRRLVDPLVEITDRDAADIVKLRPVCARMVANLVDRPDTDDARRDARLILDVLFTHTPPPEWWRTELGVFVARTIDDAVIVERRVTRSEAAAILGVHMGTISQLVARGTLPSDDGGIALGDVLARLARLHASA